MDWQKELAKQWKGITNEDILVKLETITEIRPQAKATSNTYKQSFLADPNIKSSVIKQKIKNKLSSIPHSITYSVDVSRNIAQIDIMPPKANKKAALQFLLKKLMIDSSEVITSGDTGNDLSMLTGPYRSILVANAGEEVKKDYVKLAKKKGISSRIFIAKTTKEKNGNYAAGIVQGLEHHLEK
jgi:hydroxymethylpyrimidine pyrophosphatase-like HAD family hydrolase